jgi:eukaryotic-like serine/threonine-protein kinase
MFETFGRYQLLKKVAKGGMGEIFLARQQGVQGFEKLLVVKKILAHHNEEDEFIKMFLDEARITAGLNHPNIAQIFDLGEQDGSYYIAMEYVRGEDVRRIWKRMHERKQKMPPGIVARIVADAAAGLDFAHRAVDSKGRHLGLIHRDVSPQNILVSFEGGVKLIDFGVAKAAGRMQQTAAGVLKGKYAYMSPEQAAGDEIDHRSDIFALGVVCCELLTDGRLFKRETDTQTLKAVTECQVIPPSQIVPSVPTSLDALVLKALARNRDNRFRDAQEMRLAFEEWIVEARAPGSAAHLAQFMQTLYTERIAEERRLGHPPWDEQSQDSAGTKGKTVPGRSKVRSTTRPDDEGATPSWRRLVGIASGIGIAVGGLIALIVLIALRTPPSVIWLEIDPPGATVFRDNMLIGQGRVRLQGEPSTSITVSIRSDGYETLERRVEFRKEPEITLRLKLKPLPAPTVVVHVETTPEGAGAYVGDRQQCSTPCDLTLPRGSGTTEVTFRKTGFNPELRSIPGENPPADLVVELTATAATPKVKPKTTKPHANDIQLTR